MIVWHRTTNAHAARIETVGFGFYDSNPYGSSGVWVYDRILDLHYGTFDGEAVFRIELPVSVFEQYEVIEGRVGGDYRDAVIPADVLNRYPRQLGTECTECSRWTPWPLEEIPEHAWHEVDDAEMAEADERGLFAYPVEKIVICSECSCLGNLP
jgi:hypothetical protein